ncbi:DUF4365 domain-containing protein [Streptomyces sp. SID5473]|uniref:DUF4365 domain-containing protein n=1 Tax=Streptomyces sp. SID5473 TaxID=2690299 RepID=UPI00025CDCD7|nr:hypothetical protein [Streptomyces tsukubensis NRRL18488]MYS67813.1 DUF4365 domain-containing protein [Streptomyces sp. SID5473]
MNAVRTLLEAHGHIVQEIEGGNDHGEDLHVLLTRSGRRTGHVLAIQVKAGNKYKRAKDYTLPIDDHHEDWKESRIPVVGIVYDVTTKALVWVNLTEELNKTTNPVKRIIIPPTSRLNSDTILDFAAQIEGYIDSTGMKLRDFTLEEAFAAISRALDGLDPNKAPNPLFEGWAEILLRHELPAKRIARLSFQVSPLLLLAFLLVFEWPHQVRFVRNYTELNPVLTVGGLYIFISWLALTIFFELRAKRRPKETGNWLITTCTLYLWVPVIDDGSAPEWMGDSLIVSSVLISHFGLLTLLTFYVKQEMERKKHRLPK